MLMQTEFAPVPLKDDEKARIHAEYVTLLVHVKALQENAELDTAKEYWHRLLTVQQYENCCNINEYALRFLTRTFNECKIEAQVSAIDSIKTSSRRLKHETAEKLTFISTNGPHPLVALNVIKEGSVRFILCRKTVAFCFEWDILSIKEALT